MSILQMQWKHKAYHDRNALQNHHTVCFLILSFHSLHKEQFSVQCLNKSRSLMPDLCCVNDPLELRDVDIFPIFLAVYLLLLLIALWDAFSFAFSPLCVHLAFCVAKRLLWRVHKV